VITDQDIKQLIIVTNDPQQQLLALLLLYLLTWTCDEPTNYFLCAIWISL